MSWSVIALYLYPQGHGFHQIVVAPRIGSDVRFHLRTAPSVEAVVHVGGEGLRVEAGQSILTAIDH